MGRGRSWTEAEDALVVRALLSTDGTDAAVLAMCRPLLDRSDIGIEARAKIVRRRMRQGTPEAHRIEDRVPEPVRHSERPERCGCGNRVLAVTVDGDWACPICGTVYYRAGVLV